MTAPAPSPGRLDMLGVPLDPLSPAEVEGWLRGALTDAWDGRCRHLVTLNPEYVMAARADAVFASALRDADLAVADGVGVVLAARLIDGARLSRQTGVALTDRLTAASGELPAPIFLLGAGPGVAQDAAARLSAQHADAHIAGVWDGGTPLPTHDLEALTRIGASGARVVLVAYGAPGQVTWIARNGSALAASGVRLAIGVGGALDVLSGRLPHPPRLVRRLGLEWAYRLAREPWRWRRQLALPRFAALALLAAARRRLPRR